MTVKKSILILISLCSFVFASSTTNNSLVDLYQSPNASSESIDQIGHDTPFEVSIGDWIHLTKLNTNETGWVLKAQLEQLTGHTFSYQINFSGYSQSKKSDLSAYSPHGNVSSISIHKLPDAKSPISGTLLQNDAIEVGFGEWLYVTNLKTNKSGWANRAKLEELTGFNFDFKSRLSSSSYFSSSIQSDIKTINFKKPKLQLPPEEEIIDELRIASKKIKSAMRKTRDLFRKMNHAMKQNSL